MTEKARDSDIFYYDMIRTLKERIDDKNWAGTIDVLTMLIKLDGKDITSFLPVSEDVKPKFLPVDNEAKTSSESVVTPANDFSFDKDNEISKVIPSYSVSTTDTDNFILDYLWKSENYTKHHIHLLDAYKVKFGDKFNSHDLKPTKSPNISQWQARIYDRQSELKKKNLTRSVGKGIYALSYDYITKRKSESSQLSMKY
jgi:hypothetical protein